MKQPTVVLAFTDLRLHDDPRAREWLKECQDKINEELENGYLIEGWNQMKMTIEEMS